MPRAPISTATGGRNPPPSSTTHRIVAFGVTGAAFLKNLNLLLTLEREAKKPRAPAISINNIFAMLKVVEKGGGIGILPDYVIDEDSPLVQLDLGADMPVFECWLAYPEEMKNVARVMAFRDFLVANAPLWRF